MCGLLPRSAFFLPTVGVAPIVAGGFLGVIAVSAVPLDPLSTALGGAKAIGSPRLVATIATALATFGRAADYTTTVDAVDAISTRFRRCWALCSGIQQCVVKQPAN